MKKNILLLIGVWLASGFLHAQFNPATVKEYKKVFVTYPFSDPNPIPVMNGIYPYFRFEGFTEKPVAKEWKIVELENDFIKLLITPEIGGKIWSALEKSTGKEFVYTNQVVKFRDIAMRGPWTSGGIEPNYGIIGHTPNCATPVDYLTRANDDGSVSCIIGALDLLTRTSWRIEITLPKDKAYFTTKSFWHNATPFEQPYYTWMNTGIKARGNLEFIYPGTHYLGHDGEFAAWPVHPGSKKNISFYEQNNFGGYKSYHVFGTYTDFFGAFWHDENFGMGRYSTHDDKPGKKIWIWGLSPQGMIWEKLLTDSDGQYVEVQSGRLFNQTAEASTLTPFKHRGYSPYASDGWTEYWFPVKQTEGFVTANNFGALNLKYENGLLKIFFSPLQEVHEQLEIFAAGKAIYNQRVDRLPLQLFSDTVKVEINPFKLTATLGKNKLDYHSDPETENLSRPLASPNNFNWDSVYGLYLQGKELIRSRSYARAEEKLAVCLAKDSNYLPALNDLAMLMVRKMDFSTALAHTLKGLSIDTYDAAANYYYGLANMQLGKMTDAKDGFDIASQSIEYRCAAYTMLAKIYLRENNLPRAADYVEKSLNFNKYNLDGYQLKAVIARIENQSSAAKKELDRILEIDPLNHFARFENYLWRKSNPAKNGFLALVRNEMPEETFLELAIWYHSIGRADECRTVLELAAQNPEVIYWLAFLENNLARQAGLIEKATALSPRLVFPFRSESAAVLKWVCSQSDSWLPRYYLGLIYWDRNEVGLAKKFFAECGFKPAYGPFYAARAELFRDADKLFITDLNRAMLLQPDEWRYGKILADFFIAKKMAANALRTARQYHQKFPGNYMIGMTHAKALLLSKKYLNCTKTLNSLHVLPYEGSADGRQLHKEAWLLLAIAALKKNRPNEALQHIARAKEWPQNLGAGKPYPQDIDERLEDWLEFSCYQLLKNKLQAEKSLSRMVGQQKNVFGFNTLLAALACKELGEIIKGESMLNDWLTQEPQNGIAQWGVNVFKGVYTEPKAEWLDNVDLRIFNEFSLHLLPDLPGVR